jgi:hypothetical protein
MVSFSGSLVGVGLSVGLGVSVGVIGGGVGEYAAAVWVCMPEANSATSVPMVSTGGGVGWGAAQAAKIRIAASKITIRRRECSFISSPVEGNVEIYYEANLDCNVFNPGCCCFVSRGVDLPGITYTITFNIIPGWVAYSF